MIKKDYIERLYDMGLGSKKDIGEIINNLFDLMANDLKNNQKITISNFGTFDVNVGKPRDIYSPYDGKLIKSVEAKYIRFKPSSNLKDN